MFVVSILGEHKAYEFADKIPLDKCIADILEDEVDEKYYLSEEVQNRLTTMQAELRGPKVLRYERTEYGKSIRKQYEKGEIKEKICNMREMKPREDGISNTITTVQKDNYLLEPTYRIRKLTPRECFRLMGLKDDDIDKIQQAGISNAQQYKMAGNSIVVDVLEVIFKNLFLD